MPMKATRLPRLDTATRDAAIAIRQLPYRAGPFLPSLIFIEGALSVARNLTIGAMRRN